MLAAAVQVNYPTAQAISDLGNVAPIVAVVVTLLIVVVVDLVAPPLVRGPLTAVLSCVGLLVSLAIAVYRYVYDYGSGGAYFGMASGDRFSLFFEMLLAVLGILTVVVSSSFVRRRLLVEAELHVLTLAAVVGMMALASATSLVSVFLGLETFSIALYVACGYNRTETASQESAAKYLIIGGFASAFVLYGMALVYGATGTTLLDEIAKRVSADGTGNPLLVLGVLLMGVGFAYKISGVPFHQWTPDVYQGAPLPVTAFMSVGTKAAAFAMIIRVFEYGLGHMSADWQVLLAFVSVASMVLGNLVAIVQSSVKRMLAYSGIAHAGYLLIGVLAGGPRGVSAVLFYLFAYLFMNFGAFAVVSTLATADSDRDAFSDLDGLGFRSPTLGVLMSVFMLSLAGFPPLVGFFGKLFVFTAGVQAGWTWLVVVAVLASVVSVYYYLRVLVHVWSPLPEARRAVLPSGTRGVRLVVGFSAVFAVVLGIVSGPLLQMSLSGAAPLFLAGR
jgi:NADH-quinone oxidoreductase subunit N